MYFFLVVRYVAVVCHWAALRTGYYALMCHESLTFGITSRLVNTSHMALNMTTPKRATLD